MTAVTTVALKRLMLAETLVAGIHVPRTTPNYALIPADKPLPVLEHARLPLPLVLRTHACPAPRKRPEGSPLMRRSS